MKISSFRRGLIDHALEGARPLMAGRVLDIGGQRKKRRGTFVPPVEQVESWEYLNIDETTEPDYCCSAENIPVDDGTINTVLLMEVLEHLERPEKVLAEASRVLKPGGVLLLSMPFLYPQHGAPYDFQRWTAAKIASELERAGFTSIEVSGLGGVGAVVFDLMALASKKVRPKILKNILRTLLFISRPVWKLMESMFSASARNITTGHFATARK